MGSEVVTARTRWWAARSCALLALGVGIATAAVSDDRPVALPPFIVEEAAKGPPWRYAEARGYEILSRCSDRVTQRVVEAHHRLHVLLAEILPVELQVRMAVPRALILYDEELQPAASREVIVRMLQSTPAPGADELPGIGAFGGRGRLPPPASQRRYSFLPNLRLWDRDSMSVFMIVRRDDFDADRLALTHDYVSFLVKRRVPALPPWFIHGFLSLYREIEYRGDRLALGPMPWISGPQSDAVKKDPKAGTASLSLENLLQHTLDRDANAPVDPIALWQAQALLFVRWGLDPAGGERRAAFWRFVERAAIEGGSGKLFRECFGFDVATGQAQLAAYLPQAVRRTIQFRPAKAAKLPALALRDASDAHIARLKGDWERLEVPYVKGISPELAPKYLEQARRTLRRAYDRGERDAQLLAVMGLCECDAGNDAGARELLEAAANIGSLRPRANYELARLRLAEFMTKPAAAGGRLSVHQTAGVLRPLFEARAAPPPLAEVYELIAEAWAASSSPPTRGHLAVLDEGVQLFPRRTELVLRSAELNLRHGFRENAGVLAEIAGRLANDDATRERLAALRQGLAP